MKNLSKTPSSGKSAVRQIRGPGMNLGLKKPGRIAKPKPYKPPRQKKSDKVGSLLPSGMFSTGGKVLSTKEC